jgi:GxxExxY protein
MQVNDVTERIIGCAIEVHRQLGSGFLESAYQAAMAYEVKKAGLRFEPEKVLPVPYKDIILKVGFRCDFLVEGCVILECKAVIELSPIELAQVLNYLKITKLQVGLLVNFNVLKLTDGIRRVANKYHTG